jgi:YD repeat-containing protein
LPFKQSDTPLKKVFIYDKYGRNTGEESIAGTISFNYSGKTLLVTTSAGQTSSKTYDSQGNIVSASDDAGSIT